MKITKTISMDLEIATNPKYLQVTNKSDLINDLLKHWIINQYNFELNKKYKFETTQGKKHSGMIFLNRNSFFSKFENSETKDILQIANNNIIISTIEEEN